MSAQVTMTSLSKRFHYTPISSLSSQPRPDNAPKLIFLFAWMGAKLPHVQKYINGYSAIWPSTPIVLVQSLPHDFRPFSRFASEYGPLTSLVARYDIDTQSSTDNGVLMITMSNGGCWSAQAFLHSLPKDSMFRPRALIHDSCPGLPRYRNTLTAFLIAGKYRLFSKAVATIVITIYYFLSRSVDFVLRRHVVGDMRKEMLQRIKPKTRLYIYSKTDALINYRDVESHISAAEKTDDDCVVRKEVFDGSAHVMHLRTDPARYWKLVQDAWDSSSTKKPVSSSSPSQSVSDSPTSEPAHRGTLLLAASDLADSVTAAAAASEPLDRALTPDAPPLSSTSPYKFAHSAAQDFTPSNSMAEDSPASTLTTSEAALTPGATDAFPKEAETASVTSIKAEQIAESSDNEAQQQGQKQEEEEEEEEDDDDDDVDDDTADEDLDSSVLGTKEYWTKFYNVELNNYTDHKDEGEIWFGEESEARITRYLQSQYPQDSALAVLDLGTGNGHLLFTLHDAGFTHWRMKGIDYAASSVQLATRINQSRKLKNITFQAEDFLQTTTATGSATFDLVLDKGTFDAISLSDQVDAQGNKIWVGYETAVARRMKRDGGRLIVTSCNWTQEELIRRLTSRGLLKVHAFFKAQKQAFQFGGKSGSTTSQVVFKLV